MEFKSICVEDKPIFDKFIKPYTFSTCEYSFTNLYLWRKGCEIKYCIYNDTLIIKKSGFDASDYFMQPIGYKKENLKDLVEALYKYKEENNMEYLFKDAEASFIEDLNEIFPGKFEIKEDRDNFDYIYDSKDLISLSGKKFHGQKGHYNHFVKNNEYRVSEYEEHIGCECIKASREWCSKNFCKGYLLFELKGIEDVIRNGDKLDIDCMAVYLKDKVVAFTIGERVNDDMAIIHVEKADADIKGLYAFINKTFVERYYSDAKYINREQDLGMEGLRKVKESYHPVIMGKKFSVK